MKSNILFGALLISTYALYSQTKTTQQQKDSILPETLNEVIIISNNFQSQLKEIPRAVAVINESQIKSNNQVNIAPILNSVAGVYMHNGTLTTNRITIRGIGSRNLFGTSKLRAYYQDIPLTNGTGSSSIEDIEMSVLGQIEVFKGPSSSTYGAGLGGTIQLTPNKGSFNEISGNAGFTFGSYGLQKYLVQAGIGNQNNSLNVTYSNISSDGYRDNNETDRQTITLASRHYLSEKDQLTFLLNYIDLKAFIPSSINETDYLNEPTKAAFTWGSAKGYEDYKKGLFGISWQHEYNATMKQYTSVFGSFLDSYEPRPFNILQEKTSGVGVRTRFINNTTLFNHNFDWIIGGELFYDQNKYQTFENLYQDYPPGHGSVQGNMFSDIKEKRSYFNIFLDTKYHFSETTALTIGLNLNKTSYTLDDKFNSGSTNFSGDYSFDAIISPKIGLTHQVSDNTMLYGTIAHGFSPPSLEEVLLPDGLINPDIEPETGWNYEVGSRGDFFENRLHLELALFHMAVKNLLVARRTGDDEFIGVNAGKTSYSGAEFTFNYQFIKSENIGLSLNNAFAYNSFEFKDFVDDTNDYSGNDLTGVPDVTFNSMLVLDTKLGLYANLHYNHVGAIPMRDDNSVYSDAYNVVNTKVGFRTNQNKKLQLDVYAGINNLFDEKYASMLLINAGSFGGNAPRYYYPGEPTNYYAGVNLKYLF